jgi:hypothetical protein
MQLSFTILSALAFAAPVAVPNPAPAGFKTGLGIGAALAAPWTALFVTNHHKNNYGY